jgi:hypothetical protein
MYIYVSGERNASIFMDENYAKQDAGKQQDLL